MSNHLHLFTVGVPGVVHQAEEKVVIGVRLDELVDVALHVLFDEGLQLLVNVRGHLEVAQVLD